MPAYTWSTGETITATLLNNLETEAWRSGNAVGFDSDTALFTTTSASYVDITNLSVSFTAKASSVIIAANFTFFNLNIVQISTFAIRVNSVDYLIGHGSNANNSTSATCLSGFIQATGLTPGNTYTAQARVATTGANTVYVSRYIQSGTGQASRSAVVVIDVTK